MKTEFEKAVLKVYEKFLSLSDDEIMDKIRSLEDGDYAQIIRATNYLNTSYGSWFINWKTSLNTTPLKVQFESNVNYDYVCSHLWTGYSSIYNEPSAYLEFHRDLLGKENEGVFEAENDEEEEIWAAAA